MRVEETHLCCCIMYLPSIPSTCPIAIDLVVVMVCLAVVFIVVVVLPSLGQEPE